MEGGGMEGGYEDEEEEEEEGPTLAQLYATPAQR